MFVHQVFLDTLAILGVMDKGDLTLEVLPTLLTVPAHPQVMSSIQMLPHMRPKNISDIGENAFSNGYPMEKLRASLSSKFIYIVVLM